MNDGRKARRRGRSAEVLVPLAPLDLEGGRLAGAEDEGLGRRVVAVLLQLARRPVRRRGRRAAQISARRWRYSAL